MLSRSISHSIAVTALFAVLLTATVPYFCSTGWCCAKHQQEQARDQETPSCCAHESAPAVDQAKANCCTETSTQSDKPGQPRDSGCATGCCKLAATPYVLSANLTIVLLPPLTTLTPADALNTGIELSDYIPQPPRVLAA